MLEIEVNKKKILLTGKAKIKLTYRNYNFEDAFANKVVSMPFDAPLNGINLEIFGFENMPNFETFFTDGHATLYYKSIPFLQGKIQILSNNRSTIKLSFFEETDFVELPDINLNEINLGGNRTLAADVAGLLTFAKDNLALNYPTTDFNFPTIYNPKFIDESVTEFSKVMNRFGTRFGDYFPQNSIDFPRADCLVPQPFLMYVIKQVFAHIGFTINGDFVDDTDLKQILLYANHALDSKEVITLYPQNAKAKLTANQQTAGDPDEQYADFWEPDGIPIGDDVPYVPADYYETIPTCLVVFNDKSSTGFYDNSGLYFEASGEYKVTTTKQHTITYSIKLGALLADDGTPAGDFTKNWFNFLIVGYVWNSKGEAVPDSEYFLEKTRTEMYALLDDDYNYIFTKTFDFTPTSDDLEKYLTVKIQVKRVFNNTGTGGIIDGRVETVRAVVKANSYYQIDVEPDIYNVGTYNPVYNMQNSVPIITCKNFIKMMKDLFNLSFLWDKENKTCTINFFDEILNESNQVNYSNKAEFDFEKKQKSFTINGLKYLIPEKDIAAEQLTLAQKEYNIEQATNVIALNATPLGYCFTGYARQGAGFCLVPWIEESGNSGFDGTTTNNRQNVRLMFWRGLTTNTIGQQYPKALSYNIDINGNPTSEATLTLNGATGIVEKYYANYMQRFNNSAEFSRRFLLNIIDIKNLNTNDTWLVDYGKYTLKQLDVEIGENIEPAEATLLKID